MSPLKETMPIPNAHFNKCHRRRLNVILVKQQILNGSPPSPNKTYYTCKKAVEFTGNTPCIVHWLRPLSTLYIITFTGSPKSRNSYQNLLSSVI